MDLDPMLGWEVLSADREQVGGIVCSFQTSSIVNNIVHCAKPSLTVGIAW